MRITASFLTFAFQSSVVVCIHIPVIYFLCVCVCVCVQLITSQVKLTSTAPDDVTLSYTSHCTDTDVVPGASTCDGLSLGDTVWFDIGITAQTCLESDDGMAR